MNLDQALQTFIIESRELLADMETALLAVEQADDKTELVNAIFRAAHTIKGSAGLFGLDHIVAFTHVVESVLDRARDGKLQIIDGLVSLLLACGDHISTLIDAVAAGQTAKDNEVTLQGASMLSQLQTYLGAGNVAAIHPVALAEHDIDATERIGAKSSAVDHWHISLRFGQEVLRNGMDPFPSKSRSTR